VSGGGQHRTPSELARKGTFGETTLGGALAYRRAGLHLGVTGYRARFSRPLRPGDRPYRRFRVTGDGTSMLGGYGTVFLGDYTVFGDVARSPRGTFGGLLGAALDGDYAEAVVVGRRYPPDFASFYGNAFGDGSRPQNEMGVYTGLQLQLAPKWSVGAYLDQYRAPWLQFNVPRPSTGWEARVVLDYAPVPGFPVTFRFAYKTRTRGRSTAVPVGPSKACSENAGTRHGGIPNTCSATP
jgi:hypothetical protein